MNSEKRVKRDLVWSKSVCIEVVRDGRVLGFKIWPYGLLLTNWPG